MNAILCNGHGDISVLNLAETARPQLKAGQVRIRVRASGVNRADTVQREGHYPPPPGESDILGLEVSGDIVETSPDVRQFRAGDRVMALLAGGGYAEEVTVDAGLVLPLPRGFSYDQGAAVMEVFITAHHNLFTLGQVTRGSTALLHAGASGVGTAGIQLLRGVCKEVYVTVGSPEKAKACEKLGATAILYKREPFAERVKAATEGRGVDVILDPVGAAYLSPDLDAIAIEGRIVLIGLMSGSRGEIDLGRLLRKRVRLIGSTLRGLPLTSKREAVERFRKHCMVPFEQGEIAPVIDKVFPATQVREAHKYMEANANIGKILLSWDA